MHVCGGETSSIHAHGSPQASLLLWQHLPSQFPNVEVGASITHSLQPHDAWATSPGWRLVRMDAGSRRDRSWALGLFSYSKGL